MKKRFLATLVVTLLIISHFFLLNYLKPLRADDFGRASTNTLAKGLIIMAHSIQSDYTHWTGRVSAQALIYLLLSKKYIVASTFIINLINAISFYIFTLFSFRIITLGKTKT